MPKEPLAAFDHKIIAALQKDGRLSNVELAERIGLSPSPCLRRVKRLEREGYIDAYRAVLDRARVGLGFTVFVGVRLEAHANDRAGSFEEAVLALREVIACHMVSGTVDYLLEVVVPDLAHYQKFLVDRLLALSIVREVQSSIAINTLKAGAPLPLDHLDAAQSSNRRSAT
jgi:Lrp/AsnC family transcriptional regulator, leucine-responsive regulatory protein